AFGAAERYVALYGAKRLLFGSDMSDLPIPWGLGPILYADISEADKRAILGGNLRRLLQTHSRPA
ncbi:MAG: amidohydrolase family protein, partial [Candidatus Brocadiia bacterium]